MLPNLDFNNIRLNDKQQTDYSITVKTIRGENLFLLEEHLKHVNVILMEFPVIVCITNHFVIF